MTRKKKYLSPCLKHHAGHWWSPYWECEDSRKKRGDVPSPLWLKRNKWKTPRERQLWTDLFPGVWGHRDQHQCWLGRAKPQPWNTASGTLFWSQLLTLFIVSSSGSDNSIKGFTGLYVHQIHKAPHGSTTETSQKSMKSLPEGFMKDFSSKTVFASMSHDGRGRAGCRQPLAPTVFIKLYYEKIFTESELRLCHFIWNAQQTANLCVPRPLWHFHVLEVWCTN